MKAATYKRLIELHLLNPLLYFYSPLLYTSSEKELKPKIGFFGLCVKNLLISGNKVERLMRRIEDREVQFCLRVFEEDRRKVEKMLRSFVRKN